MSLGILLWLKKKVARDTGLVRRSAPHFWESAPSFPGALTKWLKSLVTHRCFAAICQQLIIANLFTQSSAVRENLLSLLNLFIQLLSIFPQNQTAPGLWETAIHVPRWASQLVPTSMKFPNFSSGSESWIWRLNYSTVSQRKFFTGWGIAITCQMHPHPGTDYMHYWPQLNHENNKASPGQESFWQNLVSLEEADENLTYFTDTCCMHWAPDKSRAGSGCAGSAGHSLPALSRWPRSPSVQDPSAYRRGQVRPNTEANFCLNWKRTSPHAKVFWRIQEQFCRVCSRTWVSAWPPAAMDHVGHQIVFLTLVDTEHLKIITQQIANLAIKMQPTVSDHHHWILLMWAGFY